MRSAKAGVVDAPLATSSAGSSCAARSRRPARARDKLIFALDRDQRGEQIRRERLTGARRDMLEHQHRVAAQRGGVAHDAAGGAACHEVERPERAGVAELPGLLRPPPAGR